MNEIIYKLPKGIELSGYIQERALAYLDVQLQGLHYYVPITKEVKKQFGLIERKGKLIPTNWKMFRRLYDIVQIIIDSIYLQVRDVVCEDIESKLDSKLTDTFSFLFKKYLHKQVDNEINKKLPNNLKNE
jgi:hypothetical protein